MILVRASRLEHRAACMAKHCTASYQDVALLFTYASPRELKFVVFKKLVYTG